MYGNCEQFYSPTGRNCPLFSDRSVNKEKPDREVRRCAEIVHGRHARPSMMAIQGECQNWMGEKWETSRHRRWEDGRQAAQPRRVGGTCYGVRSRHPDTTTNASPGSTPPAGSGGRGEPAEPVLPGGRRIGGRPPGPAARKNHAAFRSSATSTPWMISSRAGTRSGKSSFSARRNGLPFLTR